MKPIPYPPRQSEERRAKSGLIAALLILSTLLSPLYAFAQTTSVSFPLNTLFGGAAYNKPLTITAQNSLITDGVNLWAGTYTIVPASTKNPTVSLYPNTYLLTVPGVVKATRFTVPVSTNTLDVTTLITSGPLFYFGTNGMINLWPGSGIVFTTNADGSITMSSAGATPNIGAGTNVVLTTNAGIIYINQSGAGVSPALSPGANITFQTNSGVITISSQGGSGASPLGSSATISLDTNAGVVIPSVVSAPLVTGFQSNTIALAVTNTETGVTLSGTFTGSLSGNAATATTATSVSGSVPMSQVTGTVPLNQLPTAVITNNGIAAPVSLSLNNGAFIFTNKGTSYYLGDVQYRSTGFEMQFDLNLGRLLTGASTGATFSTNTILDDGAGNATFNSVKALSYTGNGGPLTNEPYIKTLSISGGSVTFTQNPDGSTNAALTVTAGGSGNPAAALTNNPAPQIFSGIQNLTNANNFLVSTNAPLNVKAYGAVGNGIVDDTAAIQTTLNHVFTNGGGSVYIPSGFYHLSYYLSVPPNCLVYGDGGSSVLQQHGNYPVLYAGQQNNTEYINAAFTGATNNFFRNFVIDCTAGSWGCSLQSLTNGCLENLIFLNCGGQVNGWSGYGVHVEDAGFGGCRNVMIKNCIFYASEFVGVDLDHAASCSVIGCSFYPATGIGILLNNSSSNCVVMGNVLQSVPVNVSPYNWGITLDTPGITEYNTIIGNSITGFYQGLNTAELAGITNNSVIGNVVTGCTTAFQNYLTTLNGWEIVGNIGIPDYLPSLNAAGQTFTNSFDATNAAWNALKTGTNSFEPTNSTLGLWQLQTPTAFSNAAITAAGAAIAGSNYLTSTTAAVTNLNVTTLSAVQTNAPNTFQYMGVTYTGISGWGNHWETGLTNGVVRWDSLKDFTYVTNYPPVMSGNALHPYTNNWFAANTGTLTLIGSLTGNCSTNTNGTASMFVQAEFACATAGGTPQRMAQEGGLTFPGDVDIEFKGAANGIIYFYATPDNAWTTNTMTYQFKVTTGVSY